MQFHSKMNCPSATYGIIACVASVSNRVIARKLEREQKKKKDGRERGKGEEETLACTPHDLKNAP